MKIELLKENELNSVVGGTGGIFKNFREGMIIGLISGAYAYKEGVRSFISAKNSATAGSDDNINRGKGFAENCAQGTGDFVGATTHYVITGAAVYGCFKVGELIINKIRRKK